MVDCFAMEALPVLRVSAPWSFGVLGTTWIAKAGLLDEMLRTEQNVLFGRCYVAMLELCDHPCNLSTFLVLKMFDQIEGRLQWWKFFGNRGYLLF